MRNVFRNKTKDTKKTEISVCLNATEVGIFEKKTNSPLNRAQL